MASVTITVSADIRGPLASGDAGRALRDWAENTARVLGGQGADLLRAVPMNKTGRATGAFAANLHVLQSGPVARIPAPMIRGVTWGPWLEGVSSRNSSTRFRGYHLFRHARQELRRRAPEVGQRELEKIMPRIGGM